MIEMELRFTISHLSPVVPDDFIEISEDFAIPANHVSDLCVNVTIIPDNIFEVDETFIVLLSSNDVPLCASSFVFVTIVDDTCKNRIEPALGRDLRSTWRARFRHSLQNTILLVYTSSVQLLCY